MKTKKIVSLLLAVIMIVGLLPMSAIAEGTGKLIATVRGTGVYTDMDTLPEESYEYTVKGSDGSNSVITMLGSDAATGNTKKQVLTKGEIYYTRVRDPYKLNQATGILVNNNKVATSSNEGKCPLVTVETDPYRGTHVKGELKDAEWVFNGNQKSDDQRVSLKSVNNNKYIKIVNDGLSGAYGKLAWDDGESPFRYKDKNGGYGLYYDVKAWNWYLISWTSGNSILRYDKKMGDEGAFHFHTKVVVSEDGYIIDASALEALIAEAGKREFDKSYEKNSWNVFQGALADAKNVLAETKKGNDGKVFYGEDTNAMLARVDAAHIALQNAINGLKFEISLNECVMPEITWTRSYGDAKKDPSDERVKGLTTVEENAEKNFPIVWKWDDIKNIKASSTIPWYTNDEGMEVGTWADEDDGWTKSSVRRISGTFIWPYGYDFNDKAEILSVNDSVDKKSGAYADLYKYIEDNKNTEEGKKIYDRYKNSRVFAVNDNAYVFISKADEQPADWTADEAAQRMAFWTGTDGKGQWTDTKHKSGDFARTKPATFLGKSAVPSFKGTWPNVEDMNMAAGNAFNSENVKEWDSGTLNSSMAHSEKWYSLVDTSNIMTTLKNTYGSEDMGGQLMRIEVFAFDNTGSGGMDKLKIRICSPSADDVPVQVDYFMNVGGNRIKLDNMSTIFYTTDNAHHVLPAGTLVNELNYAKAEAERLAPEGTVVGDGVQINKDFVAKKGKTNIIQVEYSATLQDMKFFSYDFATKNEFTYHDTSSTAITSVSVNGITGLSVKDYSNSSHDITLEYTPEKSVDQAKLGSITITRQGSSQTLPIAVVPASNVLYEESFMNPRNTTTAPDWKLTSKLAQDVTVTDNEADESVFGYTKEYANNKGVNGAYTVDVDSSTEGRVSEEIAFDFNGRGFDLIGTCGPTTGTIMVSVRDDQNKPVKAYMVNTAFADGEINQVPLVHCVDLPRGTYHVIVKAMCVDYAPQQKKMVYSLRNSAHAPNNAAYNALVRMGLSDEEISMVEFINIADRPNVKMYSLRNAPASTFAAPEQMKVVLDSFRVYRSTENAASAYPADECDIKYSNILDATKGSFTAYIEGDAQNENAYSVAEYRALGGPAHELYLKPKSAVAIAVADGVTNTQISLRALTAEATVRINEGEQETINHNTEMYYKVTAKDGVIVIANTSAKNVLAIGNLKCAVQKINDSQATAAVARVLRMMNAPVTPQEPEEPESGKFFPAKLNVKLSVVRGLFNNYAIVTATSSMDVDYVEINGAKYKATNKILVNAGLAKNKKFMTTVKFKKGEPIVVNVTAYDGAGIAADTIVKSK